MHDSCDERRKSSSDEPPVIEPALATRLATLTLREGVPEAEGLVPGAGDDRLAIGAHREIEDATRMARQRRDHVQRRVLPYANLVLWRSRRVAVR